MATTTKTTKLAKAPEFKPYTGPAGPTEEQAEQNTAALAAAVGGKLVPLPRTDCPEETELWAEKDGRLAIYDRWGFCNGDDEGTAELDQATFERAAEYLRTGK